MFQTSDMSIQVSRASDSLLQASMKLDTRHSQSHKVLQNARQYSLVTFDRLSAMLVTCQYNGLT